MPVIEDQIDRAGGIIKAVGALIALVPAVAMLMGVVDIPPTLAELIKALSFFIGITAVIAIMLLRDRIRRLSGKAAAILILAAVLLGSGFAAGYFLYARGHIVAVQNGPTVERHVIPLKPSPAIRAMVAPFGGDYMLALYTSAQKAELRRAIERENMSSIVLMLSLLVLANVLLVAAVVGGAWKLAGSRTKAKTRK